jgi:hypothetical protein
VDFLLRAHVAPVAPATDRMSTRNIDTAIKENNLMRGSSAIASFAHWKFFIERIRFPQSYGQSPTQYDKTAD